MANSDLKFEGNWVGKYPQYCNGAYIVAKSVFEYGIKNCNPRQDHAVRLIKIISGKAYCNCYSSVICSGSLNAAYIFEAQANLVCRALVGSAGIRIFGLHANFACRSLISAVGLLVGEPAVFV